MPKTAKCMHSKCHGRLPTVATYFKTFKHAESLASTIIDHSQACLIPLLNSWDAKEWKLQCIISNFSRISSSRTLFDTNWSRSVLRIHLLTQQADVESFHTHSVPCAFDACRIFMYNSLTSIDFQTPLTGRCYKSLNVDFRVKVRKNWKVRFI